MLKERPPPEYTICRWALFDAGQDILCTHPIKYIERGVVIVDGGVLGWADGETYMYAGFIIIKVPQRVNEAIG